MKREVFVQEFAELLDVEPSVLTPETEMGSLDNWDSVAYLSAMVMIDDRLGIALGPGVLSNATTFGVILDAVKEKLE